MEFAYDGGGLGKGGTVTLYVDGDHVRRGPVDATVPLVFSADETCDVGADTASPVSDDYTSAEAASPAPRVGPDRRRRRGREPRPPDHARASTPDRDGTPIEGSG